jgi:hypothetical protein
MANSLTSPKSLFRSTFAVRALLLLQTEITYPSPLPYTLNIQTHFTGGPCARHFLNEWMPMNLEGSWDPNLKPKMQQVGITQGTPWNCQYIWNQGKQQKRPSQRIYVTAFQIPLPTPSH